ncbi:MAG: hypothetical protein AMS22_14205 [Thiotrichales bacterium SG8_50]|nr:MAG: hypothetical protein AMS22_14205 [Thiotrichales bacterium SG8_50]
MSTPRVEPNKVVSVTYLLRNQRGDIVDYRDLPVAYVHGAGSELFPQIEQALTEKTVGETIEVTLGPDEAFGAHDPKLTFTDDLENVPPELRQIGKEFEAQSVTQIENGKLTVDANHPLAGQTITFVVTVHDIREATDDERKAGRPLDSSRLLQ